MISYGALLKLAVPEAILTVAALLTLALDLLVMRPASRLQRRLMACVVATAACSAGIFWIFNFSETTSVLNGMLESTPTIQVIKCALLGMGILLSWLTVQSDFTDHIGEYFALLLFATAGLMFLTSSSELLSLFVALELASLSLYILTGFAKTSRSSAEAAMKYFLFGGVSAAFLLFGMSLLYALTGETGLAQIAAQLKGKPLNPLLIIATIMIVTGLGFKVAAVPFHFWAPDAYEGAPAPSAGLIASSSKVASFFVLAKFLSIGLASADGSFFRQEFLPGWKPLIGMLALLSMILGNIAALAQKNVKRLLAYSAIAHAGYALLALLATGPDGRSALVFYVITYGLAVMGAFAIVGIVEESAGNAAFSDFAGLSQRSPMLGLALMVFILSLGGIPPLSGFFGKFYVFAAALHSPARPLGLFWLIVAALAASTLSLYYYMQILKQAYVAPAAANALPLRISVSSALAIAALVFGVVLLGCMPNLLLKLLH